jgi:antitoxin (DNA-binding transcriptional repressor) of toxin-antitoxin stability system
MMTFGIRNAKAHLSELVRNAANGECSLVTDNRKLVAMIGPPPSEAYGTEIPPPGDGKEAKSSPSLVDDEKPLSDAAAFRKAILGAPYPLELDF